MPRKVGRISPDVPLAQGTVFERLCDIETMFRLNPHWTINEFSLSSGSRLEKGSELTVDMEDYAKQSQHELTARCTEFEPNSGWVLSYSGGNKLSTSVFVAALNGSCRITLEETYTDEETDNLDWHQQQVEFWLRSIIAYLLLLSRKGLKAAVTRWFMRKFWIPASPSSRSISLMLVKLSAVELALIIAIIIMWALFMQK